MLIIWGIGINSVLFLNRECRHLDLESPLRIRVTVADGPFLFAPPTVMSKKTFGFAMIVKAAKEANPTHTYKTGQ